MKRVRTQPNKRSGEQGSMLVVALVVASVLGVTLGSYMVVVRSQHVSAVRSQAWHKAMSVAEAGAEEALAQLNPGAVAPAVNRSANNWAASGGWYGPVSRTLSGGGTYDVSFSADPAPIIYSTGYVAVPTLSATLTRVLRVATTNAPLFNAAVAVKSGLSMVNYSGKGLFSDS